jgi:hypothetical protein
MAAGLYWGLLCGAIANWFLFGLTKIPCAVGGTLMPSIYVISNYAEKNIGPSAPTTVLAAFAVSTAVIGVTTFVFGELTAPH